MKYFAGVLLLLSFILNTGYSEPAKGKYPFFSIVSRHGKLQVKGTYLCDKYGSKIQLRGISSHMLNTSALFITPESIRYLVNEFKIDVFRAAMYYDNEIFFNNPQDMISRVTNIVDICEKAGIYCIIDWHTITDKNPLKYKDYAKKFFEQMLDLYAKKDHVIYEICNEPNGDDVHWTNAIKPYAEEMIPLIRAKADNVILVGTGTWSQDVHEPAEDPLPFKNIMYVFHFYAGSHHQELRDRVEAAAKKIPIFVSEWGSTGNSGSGNFDPVETAKWLKLCDKYKISTCNWSFWASTEESAILNVLKLKAGSLESGKFKDEMLSPSGKLVRKYTRAQ